jgi:hypothetical protein
MPRSVFVLRCLSLRTRDRERTRRIAAQFDQRYHMEDDGEGHREYGHHHQRKRADKLVRRVDALTIAEQIDV